MAKITVPLQLEWFVDKETPEIKGDESVFKKNLIDLINKEGMNKFTMDTNVSTTELNSVLSGLSDPSLDMLSSIATTKHVSLDWLVLGDKGES